MQNFEELLTKSQIPEEEPRVTFEPSVKPPAPSPRVEITKPANAPRIQVNKTQMSGRDANIKKAIQNASNKRTARVPLARVLARRQQSITNTHRILRERAQSIHEKETGEYLNYRQLLKDPKHAKAWAHSAANEFGTRIKGTNIIHFIQKNQVPQERGRDVTYVSFSCDFKPNKEEKE